MPRFDAVIVGAGHNGLVAATLLARAGWSVCVLERRDAVGGAAVSGRPFPGVDARLSRYAYLVSLFPRALREELGVTVALRSRGGRDVTGLDALAWRGRMAQLAERVAPTLLQPLRSRREFRELVADDGLWGDLFERPLGVALERDIASDDERGIVLTDGLIGTFAPAGDPQLRPNRCFLYHVIGDGTGEWRVPVGGMGAITDQLADLARAAGVELRVAAEVLDVESDGTEAEVVLADSGPVAARHVLWGSPVPGVAAEGAQLKINMVVSRLPSLRSGVDPAEAFRGTFHVNEGYEQLERAYREAAAGFIPTVPPCELYCHSLTDGSILGPELQAAGAQTLTLFGLHMPARLFESEPEVAKAAAVAETLRSLNSVLAEPIEECLWTDGEGRPCLEAVTPVELEAKLGMPGGNIFHRDLQWPFAESEEDVGRWGVETELANVWVCGAGARRGGAVSGIPGHNAARAVLAAGR
jgi:phytoene dehydrogenase-like protein